MSLSSRTTSVSSRARARQGEQVDLVSAPDVDPAVMKTLSWADEAAAEGEYADALFFVSVVQKSGSKMPSDYQEKIQAWRVQ